jgi:hypothetical protein
MVNQHGEISPIHETLSRDHLNEWYNRDLIEPDNQLNHALKDFDRNGTAEFNVR